MRLIDADALMQKLGITDLDCEKCALNHNGFCSRGYDFSDACYSIVTAPDVDAVSRQDAIDAVAYSEDGKDAQRILGQLAPAQHDVALADATKILLDFVNGCDGGDSYLVTPDREHLRTDWGYVLEGLELIREWAERNEK